MRPVLLLLMNPLRRFAAKAISMLGHHDGLSRPVFSRGYFVGMAALVIMGLSGCVSSDQSGKALVNSWNARFGRTNTQGEGSVPWQGPNVREFVYEGIAVKDYEYKKYVDLIRRGTSWGGFGAQTASIGLNAAGTLTSGGTTKTLSAIAGAITGTSAAFSKNILFDQSITVFAGRMDALRKAKLDYIRERLAEGGYGYAEAYRDIQDYGYQGSLDAALANVSKSTPEETKKSE
jgi:hypothetical protein